MMEQRIKDLERRLADAERRIAELEAARFRTQPVQPMLVPSLPLPPWEITAIVSRQLKGVAGLARNASAE